ncbi:MAG: hypothetical protein KUG58_09400, partial [Marinosulfonomonas sp.]|nr:hypothetical protein [Marinosulfonomonas sp.]
ASSAASDVYKRQVLGMRDELQKLFGIIAESWLNYITHRHAFYHILISTELMKMATVQKRSDVDNKNAGLDILPKFSSIV